MLRSGEHVDPYNQLGLPVNEDGKQLSPAGIEMVEREFLIAALLLEKGTMKCLERAREVELYGRDTEGKAMGSMRILLSEATKGARVLGRSVSVCEIPAGEGREKIPPLLPLSSEKQPSR